MKNRKSYYLLTFFLALSGFICAPTLKAGSSESSSESYEDYSFAVEELLLNKRSRHRKHHHRHRKYKSRYSSTKITKVTITKIFSEKRLSRKHQK